MVVSPTEHFELDKWRLSAKLQASFMIFSFSVSDRVCPKIIMTSFQAKSKAKVKFWKLSM